MLSYTIRRLFLVIPTVFLALSFLFLLFFALPGDPANLIAGGGDRAVDPGVVERVEEQLRPQRPPLRPVQGLLGPNRRNGTSGESFANRRSVNDILGEKAVNSLRLAFWAVLIEIVVGISVGVLSAVKRYSLADKLTTVGTAALSAVPVFVLGFILQYVFAVYPNKQGWPEWTKLRTQGLGPDTWAFFVIPTGEQWRYLILPAVTLACVSTALAARMTRGSMLEVMRADYMRTARAKGLGERQVIYGHGLRNAMLPVITLIGIDFGTVIGAAVLTETVYSWPGLGSEIANSITDRDLPVLLGLTLAVTVAFCLVNLLVDLSYAWFDPRIRLGEDAAA